MQGNRNKSQRGFSLVELLAVVLILAVLAAVAVPLYLNTRKTSAARTCKANIAAIAAAETAYALRNGAYTASITALVGASEGLAKEPKCPLDGRSYTLTAGKETTGPKSVTIECLNATDHQSAMGAADTTSWIVTLAAPATEDTSIP
jgi:prepilin-type N-terminal cleavage/methylation domain-containing protein